MKITEIASKYSKQIKQDKFPQDINSIISEAIKEALRTPELINEYAITCIDPNCKSKSIYTKEKDIYHCIDCGMSFKI